MKKGKWFIWIVIALVLGGCSKNDNVSTSNSRINSTKDSSTVIKTSSSKTKKTNFSDDEYVAAAYMAIYLETSTSNEAIDDIFYEITKESSDIFTFKKSDNDFILNQGNENSTTTFKVDKENIYGSSKDSNFEWTKKDLDSKFKDYKKLVEKLVIIGEENTKKPTSKKNEQKKEAIDTKSLTEEQAIDWVKHYLITNGATFDELEKKATFQTSMVDGFLVISEYLPVPTGAHNKLTYQYRINNEGYLEMTDVSTSDDWDVVSETYIFKEDLNAPIAKNEDISAVMTQEGHDGPGMFYTLIITNTTNKTVKVSSNDMIFEKKSNQTDSSEDIPLRYQKTVIITAGKNHEFKQILGPVSGDTPMYYNLDVSYQGNRLIRQEAAIKEYR